MIEGQEFFLTLPDDNTAEIVLTATITYFIPHRPPPPCSNHDSPAFSDIGDPGECDYELSGFIRFFPCGKGDDDLCVKLTREQCEEINDYYELDLQVLDMAEDYLMQLGRDL